MKLEDKKIIDLKKLCKTHKVEKMYLFGSALNSDFTNNSDIDFLVSFKPFDLSLYFDNYLNFKESLEKLYNRKVDLVEAQTLRNPILINSIHKSKELIFG